MFEFGQGAGAVPGRRQPLLWLAGAAALGTWAGDFGAWPSPVSLAAGAVFSLAAFRWPGARWGVLLAVAAVFCARQQMAEGESPSRMLADAVGERWRAVEAEGEVASFPEPSGEGAVRFRFRAERVAVGGVEMGGGIPMAVRWEKGEAEYGGRLRLRGRIRAVPGPRNEGEFDYRAYLRRQGVRVELRVAGIEAGEIAGPRGGSPVLRAAAAAREGMRGMLKAGLEGERERAALIESMVLGVTEDASPETARIFRETGTLHLFAVSGLNVGMFGMIFWAVLTPFGLGRRRTAAAVIPAVVFYAAITGLTPSGVRAAAMAAVVLGGIVLDRRACAGNALGAAAIGILAWDGNQLFQPGCQLSFGVVAALMAWSGPLGRWLGGLWGPDPWIPKGLLSAWEAWSSAAAARCGRFAGVCAAAWLGALPLNVLYFQSVSPVALAANLLAVPVAFAVLATGMIGVVGGMISGWLAPVFSHANWLMVGLLLEAMRLCAAVPFGHGAVGLPEPGAARGAIYLFDLRDGGAALLRAGGDAAMVDAGRLRDYRGAISPHLRRRGIGRIDGFFWTHGDVAHLGGASELLAEKRVGLVMESAARDRSATRREAGAMADARGVPRREVAAGSVWCAPGGGIAVRVLYPPEGMDRAVADDEGLVLRAEIEGVRVLFVADAGFETEQWLLERGEDLRAEVLVKGVHSRDHSGGEEFLAAVRPAAVIAGYNEFAEGEGKGVPAAFARAVERCGARLVRMEESGGVSVRIDRGRYAVEGFFGGELFTSRAR